MANGLENIRLVQQATDILVRNAANMRNNADTHIAMATAQNPDVATLRQYVNDCAAEYQRFLGYVQTALSTDPTKTKFLDGLARLNCASSDVSTPATAMKNAADALAVASKTTYAEIISCCTTFKAAVPAAASIWAE